MSDKAETMELKLHANRGEWVATVHTVRCTAPWLVKLGEKFYVRTSEPGESSFVYDHAERALSMTEVENAFDANLSVEVSRVEYAGTGVRTTGEVADAGFMPLAEDGAVFRCISAECGALAFKRELQRDGSCMCGASVHRLGGVPADQYRTLKATIAEQAAEIERLRERVSGLEQLHASWADGSLAEVTAERNALRAAVDHLKGERDTLRSALEIAAARSDSQNESISYFEQESASHDAALAELTTDRDTLRLEVQKLKDLNFEAQDRYAALEAERDELRLEVARLRDRLLQSLAEGGADQAEAEKQVCTLADELDEANARAEKYLRVIEATNANAATMVNLLMAMADAGLRMPPYLPYPAKQGEADHG